MLILSVAQKHRMIQEIPKETLFQIDLSSTSEEEPTLTDREFSLLMTILKKGLTVSYADLGLTNTAASKIKELRTLHEKHVVYAQSTNIEFCSNHLKKKTSTPLHTLPVGLDLGAAIQELLRRVQKLEADNANLREQVSHQAARLDALSSEPKVGKRKRHVEPQTPQINSEITTTSVASTDKRVKITPSDHQQHSIFRPSESVELPPIIDTDGIFKQPCPTSNKRKSSQG